MPTIGWIQEAAWDAFFEAKETIRGPGPPLPPRFRCPFCETDFSSKVLLQEHVFSDHQVLRPVLLLGGREPAREVALRDALSLDQIAIANATDAEISINGGVGKAISVDELTRTLPKLNQIEVSLKLRNASQVNATPVVNEYRISIRIAEPQALRNVELAFSDWIRAESLSRSAIDRFLNDPRCRDVGQDYAVGLAQYTMGILQKERPDFEILTTPVSQYRVSYGLALRTLVDFQRPFARLISELVRFALNDFSTPGQPTGYAELDHARALLANCGDTILPMNSEPNSSRRELCPIDHGVDQVLALATRMSVQLRWSPILDDECRQAANSGVLDAADRQKALAIWALVAWRCGAKHSAVEPLRQISATYPFSSWAERYLEMVTK